MSEDAKILSIILLGFVAFVSGGLGLWLLIDVVTDLGLGGLMLLAIPIGGLILLCMVCVVQITRMLGQDTDKDATLCSVPDEPQVRPVPDKQPRRSDRNPNSEVFVEHLPDEACLSSQHFYDIGFWSKPEKLHSVGSAGISREEAIQEIQAAFRRAGVEIVSVEVNSNSELTVWRSVCRGTGKLEGRRLGGASIKRVLWQDD